MKFRRSWWISWWRQEKFTQAKTTSGYVFYFNAYLHISILYIVFTSVIQSRKACLRLTCGRNAEWLESSSKELNIFVIIYIITHFVFNNCNILLNCDQKFCSTTRNQVVFDFVIITPNVFPYSDSSSTVMQTTLIIVSCNFKIGSPSSLFLPLWYCSVKLFAQRQPDQTLHTWWHQVILQ